MTTIEWTRGDDGAQGKSWNPVTGCTPVSEGCAHCYAQRMARRLAGRAGYPEYPDHFRVTLHPERLDEPLRWRKPRRVFVNSMSDLFHEAVPNDFIAAVFGIMALCPRHTFQVLTKRPRRMLEWFEWVESRQPGIGPFGVCTGFAYLRLGGPHTEHRQKYPLAGQWPLSNVWGLVTAENQKRADERIPWLLQTPFAVRGVSYEPALGPVDFSHYLHGCPEPYGGGHRGYVTRDMAVDAGESSWEGADMGWQELEWQQTAPPLDWLIAGAETGPGARITPLDDLRSTRDQCQAAGVPFFLKQVDAKRNRLLDGRLWEEWPCTGPYAGVQGSDAPVMGGEENGD